jgi:hypothetical protein
MRGPVKMREPVLGPARARAMEADERAAARAMALQVQTIEAALRMADSGASPPLRGSLASLERQDARLEAEGLERIEDEDDLAARIKDRLLVPVPASAALTVNPGLPRLRRYCRPWTAQFLADMARAHEAAFHRPIEVNSAVRTVTYQERLKRVNGNAAPAEGAVVSPHVLGAAVDIGKRGLSQRELAWMREQLLALELAGKIDVEEEFEQACFHITVYKNYAPAGPTGQRTQTPRTVKSRKSGASVANALAGAVLVSGQ